MIAYNNKAVSIFKTNLNFAYLGLKERVHSEMKISSIMRFNLLIMPIVLIFFQPLSLAGRKGYGKMMQVRMAWCRSRCSDAGPRMVWCRSTDGVMQVHGWCDAGPRMVRCRSSDGAMQVPGCANFRNGNSVGESRNTFEKNPCYRLNVWAIIQPLPSFHFWVDPLFKNKDIKKQLP